MVRTIITFLLLAFLGGCATVSPQLKITDAAELNNWVTYYYLKPSPERVPAMLSAVSEAGFVSWPDSIASYAGFFAEVFHQNQGRVEKWLGNLKPQGASQAILLLYAVALSDIPEKTLLMKKIETSSEVSLSTGPFPQFISAPLNDLIPASTADLDLFWGAFMASGRDVYVKKIIDVLQFLDPGEDRNKFMLGLAAYWSLSSNVLQHQKVREICRQEISKSSGRKAEILGEILNLKSL